MHQHVTVLSLDEIQISRNPTQLWFRGQQLGVFRMHYTKLRDYTTKRFMCDPRSRQAPKALAVAGTFGPGLSYVLWLPHTHSHSAPTLPSWVNSQLPLGYLCPLGVLLTSFVFCYLLSFFILMAFCIFYSFIDIFAFQWDLWMEQNGNTHSAYQASFKLSDIYNKNNKSLLWLRNMRPAILFFSVCLRCVKCFGIWSFFSFHYWLFYFLYCFKMDLTIT